jgi:hypothetical protein
VNLNNMTNAVGMIISDISSRPCPAQRSSYPTSFRASDLEDALIHAEKQKRVSLTFGRNAASLHLGKNAKSMMDNNTFREEKIQKDNVIRHGGSESTAEGQKLPTLDSHVKRTMRIPTKVAILQANDKGRTKSTSVIREREHFLKDDDDDKE